MIFPSTINRYKYYIVYKLIEEVFISSYGTLLAQESLLIWPKLISETLCKLYMMFYNSKLHIMKLAYTHNFNDYLLRKMLVLVLFIHKLDYYVHVQHSTIECVY